MFCDLAKFDSPTMSAFRRQEMLAPNRRPLGSSIGCACPSSLERLGNLFAELPKYRIGLEARRKQLALSTFLRQATRPLRTKAGDQRNAKSYMREFLTFVVQILAMVASLFKARVAKQGRVIPKLLQAFGPNRDMGLGAVCRFVPFIARNKALTSDSELQQFELEVEVPIGPTSSTVPIKGKEVRTDDSVGNRLASLVTVCGKMLRVVAIALFGCGRHSIESHLLEPKWLAKPTDFAVGFQPGLRAQANVSELTPECVLARLEPCRQIAPATRGCSPKSSEDRQTSVTRSIATQLVFVPMTRGASWVENQHVGANQSGWPNFDNHAPSPVCFP